MGEIDCVVESHGARFLVDWKTSARRWPKTQADRSLQPTSYLYAHRKLHPAEAPWFRFDVAVKNKTPVVERNLTVRTPDDFQRLECLVSKAERVIEHELFYPSDQSYFCAGCPFQEPCRAWRPNRTRHNVRSWHEPAGGGTQVNSMRRLASAYFSDFAFRLMSCACARL